MKKIVEILSKEIDVMFGVSGGGTSLSLITELEKAGVEYIPVFNEAAAAIMSGAYSYNGNQRAASITIKGPGFANMLPGALLNGFENRPNISISEAYDRSKPAWFMHKRMKQYNIGIEVFDEYFGIKDFVNTWGKSNQNQSYQCHIDLAEIQEIKRYEPEVIEYKSMVGLKKRISKYEKVSVLLGSTARGQYNWYELNVPVFTTASAKGVYNETLPYAAGIVTGEVKELSPETSVLAESDLILAIGLRHSEIIKPFDFSGDMIIIDNQNNGQHIGFDADIYYVEDIGKEIRDLFDSLELPTWGLNEVCQWRKDIEDELFSEEWLPAIVFETLNKRLDDARLVLDTGLFCTIGETIWKAKSSNHFLGSGNSRYMGVAIPTAIGASFIDRKMPTVCVVGDGGIGTYITELKTVIESELPMLIILMSDGRYGTIEVSRRLKSASRKPVEIGILNWNEILCSMGFNCQKVENLSDFNVVIDEFVDTKRATFVYLNFDPEKYCKMTQKVR